MSDKQVLEDPTNRIVSVFDSNEQAEAARRAIVEAGVADNQVRVLRGDETAADVDASAKWFADTDHEIKRYRRALRDGKTVMSLPVVDGERCEQLHSILKSHDASLITHFGTWVTEMMK